MKSENKAKVVPSVWGATFVQLFAALAVLSTVGRLWRNGWIQPVYLEETVEFNRSFWKKRLNSSFSFKSTESKQLTRQGIEHILPPKQTRRLLPCLLIPSFFYGRDTGFRSKFEFEFISGTWGTVAFWNSQTNSLLALLIF